jgi:pyruvate dehydrogenase E1 component alpha subunit/2-oxoisovalerate dehydrogenase E1 component alpha subunit
LAGHGEHDDASYVSDEIKREPFAQDPLMRTEKTIRDQKLADKETMQKWRAEAVAKVEEAVQTAQHEDAPVGTEEDWCALSTRELADHAQLEE